MKVPKPIKEELEKYSLDYTIVQGKKHYKLYVDDQLCAVFSMGTSTGGPNGFKNVVGAIRRAARQKNGAPA